MITLSTNAVVVVKEHNGDLSSIAYFGGDNDIDGNRYIFDSLKNSMKPILVSARSVLDEYESKLLKDELKASIYIPIASGYSQYYLNIGKKHARKHIPKIQGYLYLETTNTLNDFTQDRFNENLGLINLVAFVIHFA